MKSATIYTTTYCSYCRRAKDLLARRGVAFKEVDVTDDDAMRAKLVTMSGGAQTVPQIWIGEEHVGGFGDLQELDSEGRLEAMLG